jgi:hypothetical protein
MVKLRGSTFTQGTIEYAGENVIVPIAETTPTLIVIEGVPVCTCVRHGEADREGQEVAGQRPLVVVHSVALVELTAPLLPAM